MNKVLYGKYGKDERISSRELISIYQRLINNLDKNDEFYKVKMEAYSRRRNELARDDK
jgi:hypothetical protein